MLFPLELLTRLMNQHGLAFARLLGEFDLALDQSWANWSRVYPSPMHVPGGTLFGDVRARVLAMNGIDAQCRSDKSPRPVIANASCGPGSTLHMSTGPSASVRLGDSNLAWTRVRHMSPKRAEEVRLMVPQALSEPKAGTQMPLDDGLPESQRVMGPPGIVEDYDLITYWWENPGRLSVAGGILTIVEELDEEDERVVAFVDLPAAIRPKSETETKLASIRDDGEQRQFDERFPHIRSEQDESGA
ncbi:hypothetical protein [Mycolicibacter longobardus]|uniref:Uncharacterized protein n=1 Tax=Mycolicibacter longobardus TaxID=1108812 RepID=A0A1X1YAM3_9MYCO|nr:hypothetical protein [Mycolicibacter longobardus]ORW08119.1 hypothetical protein AWC16_20540 [Mycolicibacter longobardus]